MGKREDQHARQQKELMSIFTIPAGISFKTQIMELHKQQFVLIADGSQDPLLRLK